MKNYLGYFALLLCAYSCSIEKMNLSPLSESFSRSSFVENTQSESLTKNANNVVISSEITNLVATFPRFINDAVNREVSVLKTNINEFLYAFESDDAEKKRVSHCNIQESYKKLQKLRKFLNSDEDQVCNRYLVRIKTNMSLLENSKP